VQLPLNDWQLGRLFQTEHGLGWDALLDPRRLVFIDETWAKTNMTPLRVWSRCGSKLVAKAPFGQWKTLTFVVARCCDRIDVPCVLDGPINGRLFTAYVEQFLLSMFSPSMCSFGNPT